MANPAELGLAMRYGPRGQAVESMSGKEYMDHLKQELDIAVDGGIRLAVAVDHLQYGPSMDILEGMTQATFVAGRYPELTVGHAVINPVLRNPALLAKEAATVHMMSGGRFVLGIGAGWKQDEAEAYGFEFPSPSERIERLRETLEITKELWTGKEVTFEGRYYNLQGALLSVPMETPPQIMIGGGKPKMLGVVAQHADWWSADHTSLEDFKAQSATLDAACQAIGRDPQTVRRTWFGGMICYPTEQEALDVAQKLGANPDHELVGTPDQIITKLAKYREAGADLFIVRNIAWPDMTSTHLATKEVLPSLAG